jgi:hypothetical protein
VNITKPLVDCYWNARFALYTRQIAHEIAPELRKSVRRKFGTQTCATTEGKEYLQCRAAQLAQVFIDDILRRNPSLPSGIASKLVVSAARKAAKLAARTNRVH